MSYRQLDIKHSYVSYGDENIAKAFLIPMLRQTKLYRRSVGFFSSSVFSTIIDGIVSLSRNGGKIQLIASPNLSADDIQADNKTCEQSHDYHSGSFLFHFLEKFRCCSCASSFFRPASMVAISLRNTFAPASSTCSNFCRSRAFSVRSSSNSSVSSASLTAIPGCR